ncbi:MAG: Rieske 2Fe-2S domain-containing protein [Acidobacteriota bacterium]
MRRPTRIVQAARRSKVPERSALVATPSASNSQATAGPSHGPESDLPHGWYCVATSDELAAGDVRAVRYFGRELVLYRTAAGTPVLADAFCPHLGAHLGHGGRVEGELLRCPFHGFCFNTHGACESTPYPGSKPPPAAWLGQLPVDEVHGLVLAWYHPEGAPPTWTVQSRPVDGWSALSTEILELESHPQETCENGVDFGHFSEVHGFRSAEIAKPVETDGPRLRIGYRVEQLHRLPLMGEIGIEVEFDITLHGLGHSAVETRIPRYGLEIRYFVLSTPIDLGRVEMRLAARVRRLRWPGATRLVQRGALRGIVNEVLQDSVIWSRKAYLERPVLAGGDGPIPAYRRWCRQFYG